MTTLEFPPADYYKERSLEENQPVKGVTFMVLEYITISNGLPVDSYKHAGSFVDVTAFQSMNLNLPEGSEFYADAGYTDYEQEDLYQSLEKIDLRVCRKRNSKRNDEAYMAFLKNYYRKRIELTFSQITNFFPKKIHAVTKEGFVLKLDLYIFAFYSFSINPLLRNLN